MITTFQSLSTVAATSLLSAVTHTVSEAIGGRLGLSRKSPAMGGCRLGHSGRGNSGRCGDFARTCHSDIPQNYPHSHIAWQVNFGLATLGDFVKLLGNYCGTDCVLLVGGCFVCHKISTGKAVTSRDGTAQNVCNN